MKRYEALETLFGKIDLSFIKRILHEPYHPEDSPGRPQRNPVGIFKAHLVKRLKHIPSDRMLVRQMWRDPRLRKICDIEADEQRMESRCCPGSEAKSALKDWQESLTKPSTFS